MSFLRTPRPCHCGSGELAEPVYDGHGIYMISVCSQCRLARLREFRPDIFTQYEADEPIEPDGPYNDADLFPAGYTDEFFDA